MGPAVRQGRARAIVETGGPLEECQYRMRATERQGELLALLAEQAEVRGANLEAHLVGRLASEHRKPAGPAG